MQRNGGSGVWSRSQPFTSPPIQADAARFHDEVPTEIIEPLLLRLGYQRLPLTASIFGPNRIASNATGTWSIPAHEPYGGTPPYSLHWQYRLNCPAPPPPPTCSPAGCVESSGTMMAGPTDPEECGVWYDGGNDRSFSTTGSYTYPSMTVQLNVTDAAWTSIYRAMTVRFGSARAGGDSAAVAQGAVAEEAVAEEAAAQRANAPATTASLSASGVPSEYALQAVAPNPSSGRVAVRFDLPTASDVSVVVVDVLGREVARLVEGRMEAGTHEARFDGSSLPVGVYVVRLRAGTFAATRTLTLAR